MRAIVVIIFHLSFTNCIDILDSSLKRNFPHGKSELVFLLDRSGSVGAGNFEVEKSFVDSLLTEFTIAPEATRVAVISYSENVVRHIDYIGQKPKNKCHFSSEIQLVKYERGGKTNINGALIEAQNVLANARHGVKKALILLSDGISNVGGDPLTTATALKIDNVEVFTFGVGLFDKEELEKIATDKDHAFQYSSFHQFQQLAYRIRGDPHEVKWDKSVALSACDNLCADPFPGIGCCDTYAQCTCALVGGSHDCVCGPGYKGLSGLVSRCIPCPRGTYKDVLEPLEECTPCPDHATTLDVGTESIDECVCIEGYEGNPATGQQCELSTCPVLAPPANGKKVPVDCGNTFNTRCKFECNEGYQLTDVRSKARQCLPTGAWTESQALCEKIRCQSLPSPAFGSKDCSSVDLVFDSECTFKCNEGYNIQGSGNRKCGANGEWTGVDVICVGISCPAIALPENGVIAPGNCAQERQTLGARCVVGCRKGYEIIGDEILQCQPSGEWSGNGNNILCIDGEPPEVTCPNSITVETEPSLDSAVVQWDDPVVTDNDPVNPPRIEVNPAGTKSGDRFKIGFYVIEYKAIDKADKENVCYFKITVQDKEKPVVVGCPEKFSVKSQERLTPVNWEEPTFSDNSGAELTITRTHNPGDEMVWGSHLVSYTASDPEELKAVCTFTIEIGPTECENFPAPINGARACDQWLFGMICRVYCNKKYDFATIPAKWYVCQLATSEWTTLPPNLEIPWPDCSEKKIAKQARKGMKTQYYAGNCNSPKTKKAIQKAFIKAFETSEFSSSCQTEDVCVIEKVTVYCGEIDESVGRKRRSLTQQGFNMIATIDFNITASTYEDFEDERLGEQKLSELLRVLDDTGRIFENSIKTGSMELVLEDEDNEVLEVDEESYEIHDSEPFCTNGTVLLKGTKCVNCPVGTYYNLDSDKCMTCAAGMYQDEESQAECKHCEEGTWTVGDNAKNFTSCREICEPGTYSVTGLATCKSCPIGMYQDESRQTSCKSCPDGTTTWTFGTKRVEDCQDTCSPGSFSVTGILPCDPCPVGYYQNGRQQRQCIPCEGSLTTYYEGSSSQSQCVDIDACVSMPCLFGGTCIDEKFGFRCECPAGFDGATCENNIDECLAVPCSFNATCVDRVNDFSCICRPGYIGRLCSTEVDECLSNPCQNEAACQDEIDGYVCTCVNGFSGTFCEVAPNNCDAGACSHRGRCENHANGSFRCTCTSGYSGMFCEKEIEECDSNPCQNGASCIDLIGYFRCACPVGFEGVLCEVDIDDCQQNQCQHAESCVDEIGGYRCLCEPSYSGTLCDEHISDDFTLHFPSAMVSDYSFINRIPGLRAVTVGFWMKSSDQHRIGTPFSYAAYMNGLLIDNALTLTDYAAFKLFVNGEQVFTGVGANDGKWHYIAFTWESFGGSWKFYKDGQVAAKGDGFRSNQYIPPGGTVVIGQDQDAYGGGFSAKEAFLGDISRLNIWGTALSLDEIRRLSSNCRGVNVSGVVRSWADFLANRQGAVTAVSPSQFCSDLDQCQRKTCLNGGRCVDEVDDAYCACASGYQGDRCEVTSQNCNPNPCNHGTCADNDRSSYVCTCLPGFAGNVCEINIDECESNPCQHGGRCIDGVNSFQCECDPQYSGKYCEIEVECVLLFPTIHGSVTPILSRYTQGEQVIYTCEDGYRLLGSERRTCTTEGSWTGTDSLCIDVNECLQNNGDCEHTCVNMKGSYKCSCRQGFILSSDKMSCSDIDECRSDLNGECQQVCENTIGGHVCSCRDGFTLVSRTFCEDNNECASPQVCQHQCYNTLGSYQCACDPGYELSNDGTTCSVTGCGPPPRPGNGRVQRVGATAMYYCEAGFNLIGPTKRTCEPDLQWSGTNPYCKETVCLEVGPIENGQVHGSALTVGSQVRFTCNTGYSLDGTSVQTCGTDGHWYPSQRPSCQKCGLPITSFNHGSMIVSVENERIRTISYSCDSGYHMKGEHTQTCSFSVGVWRPNSVPECLKTCATPEPPRNGRIMSLQNLFHGSRVIYECKDGYELQGLAHQTCANGRWTPSKPDCILSTPDSYSFFSSLSI